MAVLVTLLAVVVALLALLVAGVLRSHAEIIRALHDLGVDLDPDTPPPTVPGGGPSTVPRDLPGRHAREREPTDVSGRTPVGDAVRIGVVGAEHSTLLAFLTSGCSTCAGFWAAFADAGRLATPGGARLVVVTKDAAEESPSRIGELAPRDVPVVMSSAAWAAYDVPVAPYFVYVDGPSGEIVGEGAAGTWDNVASLLDQALADAGLGTKRGKRRRSLRARADAAREARADRDLLRAGIEPGHPSLYPQSEADLHQSERP